MGNKTNTKTSKKLVGAYWVIGILLAVLLVGAGVVTKGFQSFSIAGGDNTGTATVTQSTANTDCARDPTISLSVNDALNKGKSVTFGTAYRVKSATGTEYTSASYTAPAGYQVGDKVAVMLNASGYITQSFDPAEVPCGTSNFAYLLTAYQAPTVTVYQDYTLLSNSLAGTVNGSKISSGTKQLTVKLSGNNQKSSGKMVYVVELSTTQNVSNTGVALYDKNGVAQKIVSVPGFYANHLSSPRVVAFELPAVVGGAEASYTLALTPSNNKMIQGAVYTRAYVEQAFIETDGTFSFGVEDADGTSKSLANFGYNFQLVE